MMQTILIAAGGTGGHIYPALAVADLLKQEGFEIIWLGAKGRLEEQLVTGRYPLTLLPIKAFRGKSILKKLRMPFDLLRSCWITWQIFRHKKPALVLAMGGFSAGPAGLVAWLMRTPLLVHEQNAVAGMTNRLLAKLTPRLLTAYPNVFNNKSAVEVGNPVRMAFIDVPPPAERLATKPPFSVLILGGSQGARFINQSLPPLMRLLSEKFDINIIHQTGKHDLASVQDLYSGMSNVTVQPFIDDVPEVMQHAQLVLARSGAMTVAEVAAVGVASVFVPFPQAVDNHQYYNAKYLADAGASVIIEQNHYNADQAFGLLSDLLTNPAKMLTMADKAWALRKTHSAQHIVTLVMQITTYAR